MRVLGIDPGVHLGWAILECDGSPRRPRFIRGNVLHGDHLELEVSRMLHNERLHSGEDLVVAIESVSGYAHDRSGRPAKVVSKRLQECAHLAGIIEGVCLGLSLRVTRAPAPKWRKYVCGNPSASDAAVKAAVHVLVEGVPTVSNAHLRDAIGAAFYVLRVTTTGVDVRPRLC